MKIRCLLVDDEPLALDVLRTHLAKVPDVTIVDACRNPLDALAVLRQQRVDLVFLDIQMPHLTGLDFVQAVERPPAFVFTTAYRDYALEGFDLDALDYLLKPIALPRLLRALDKYRTLHAAPADPGAPAAPEPAFLTVRTGRQTVHVAIPDLRYAESIGDYVKLHTSTQTLITKERISHLAEVLAPHGFLRIHRSFLVSIAHITAVGPQGVHLNTTALPVSRSYREAVRQHLRKVRP